MKIEQQVVSLELAKQLKEAGMPQDKSVWVWAAPMVFFSCSKCGHEERTELSLQLRGFTRPEYRDYAAYTPAELGEWLKHRRITVRITQIGWSVQNEWQIFIYYVTDDKDERDDITHLIRADTLADAMGEMLLYLVKEGYVKVKELL